MTKRAQIGLIASAFMSFSASQALADPAPIVWDTANAIAGGSACDAQGPFPDTWIISAGNEVSVVFSRMGVDLTPETAANTVVHSCLVRIPITVDGTVGIGQLDQTLYWGYAKDFGTEAQLSVKSTFLNAPTRAINVYLPPTVQGVEGGVESSVSDLIPNWASRFCKPTSGFFQMNVGVAARRTDKNQDISVRVAGEDIVYEAVAVWTRC